MYAFKPTCNVYLNQSHVSFGDMTVRCLDYLLGILNSVVVLLLKSEYINHEQLATGRQK